MSRDFKVVYVDQQWGEVYVSCPVCHLPYKRDGIFKHLTGMHDTNHRLWVKKNAGRYPQFNQAEKGKL